MTNRNIWPRASKQALVFRAGAALLGVGLAGALMIDGSQAAFTAQTDNKTNSVATGTVALTDDDASTKMVNLSGLNGGQVIERCINVTFAGTLTSDVKLYGVVGGTGLAAGLTTKIDVGSGAAGGSGLSCTGFTAASTPFENKSLAEFATSHGTYATGIGGFASATSGQQKSYRITMTVSNDNTYQGKNATLDLTWEAQATQTGAA